MRKQGYHTHIQSGSERRRREGRHGGRGEAQGGISPSKTFVTRLLPASSESFSRRAMCPQLRTVSRVLFQTPGTTAIVLDSSETVRKGSSRAQTRLNAWMGCGVTEMKHGAVSCKHCSRIGISG